jgi:hypothetical protein
MASTGSNKRERMQFTDQERAIFEYHDGERTVFADPLAIQRKMLRLAAGNLVGLSEAASAPEKATGPEEPGKVLERLNAQEQLLSVIREGFNLPEFDPNTGKGALEKQCWKVWDDFYGWLEKNARKGEGLPDGQQPTVSSPGPSTT